MKNCLQGFLGSYIFAFLARFFIFAYSIYCCIYCVRAFAQETASFGGLVLAHMSIYLLAILLTSLLSILFTICFLALFFFHRYKHSSEFLAFFVTLLVTSMYAIGFLAFLEGTFLGACLLSRSLVCKHCCSMRT